jgi:hypothetical protein
VVRRLPFGFPAEKQPFRSQLQAIGIQVQAVRSTTGDMATILKDSARNLQVVRNILPTLSDDVTTMRTQLPEMSDKLAPIPGISDKLDMLSQKLTVVNDMLPAIVVAMDVSKTAENV